GDVMPRARNQTIAIAMAAAITPLTDGHTPIFTSTQNTNTVTATAAAMTKPSLSLIDGTSSSGWARRSRCVMAASRRRRFRLRFAGRVPDTVHGAHDLVAELPAQRAHVGVDGAGTGPVVVAPHLGEQLLAREHARRTPREVREQIELGGGEVHELVA